MSGFAQKFAAPVLGAAGAPSTGSWIAGSIIQDSNAALWQCTVSGTPGTWVEIATSGEGLYLPLAGGTMAGNIAMGGHNITGLGNLTAAAQSAGPGSGTSTSTSFATLSVTPVTVTITTNTLALIIVTGVCFNGTAGDGTYLGFAISGATTLAASANRSLTEQNSTLTGTVNSVVGASYCYLATLTAGSNTVTVEAAVVTAGTANVSAAYLAVIPLN